MLYAWYGDDTWTARHLRSFPGGVCDPAGNSKARRERRNSAVADLVHHGVEQIRTVEGVKLLDSVMSDFPNVYSP